MPLAEGSTLQVSAVTTGIGRHGKRQCPPHAQRAERRPSWDGVSLAPARARRLLSPSLRRGCSLHLVGQGLT